MKCQKTVKHDHHKFSEPKATSSNCFLFFFQQSKTRRYSIYNDIEGKGSKASHYEQGQLGTVGLIIALNY